MEENWYLCCWFLTFTFLCPFSSLRNVWLRDILSKKPALSALGSLLVIYVMDYASLTSSFPNQCRTQKFRTSKATRHNVAGLSKRKMEKLTGRHNKMHLYSFFMINEISTRWGENMDQEVTLKGRPCTAFLPKGKDKSYIETLLSYQ